MSKSPYIRRTYLTRVGSLIGKDLIKVITGMRRTGKSTLMDQIIDGLVQDGVSESRILKYDMESGRTPRFDDWESLYDAVMTWASGKDHAYVFLDEIQNIDGWHRCVRALFTDLDADIFVTGSSSRMLSGEMATHLAGRYVEIPVMPFSFSEVADYIGQTCGMSEKELFMTYIRYGGMPIVVAGGYDPFVTGSILRAMYDSVVINDIAERRGIRNIAVLKEVMMYAMSETGHVINSSNVGNYLKSQGKKASADSVLEYLGAAEDAMLLSKVLRKDIRGREVMKIDHKYYLTDHGMREVCGFSNTASMDRILENIVYNELRHRGYNVSIGKVGSSEVDFVAERDGRPEYYQVSYLFASESTVEREFRPLASIGDNYPKYVLSMDETDLGRDGIIHRNILDWLMSRRSIRRSLVDYRSCADDLACEGVPVVLVCLVFGRRQHQHIQGHHDIGRLVVDSGSALCTFEVRIHYHQEIQVAMIICFVVCYRSEDDDQFWSEDNDDPFDDLVSLLVVEHPNPMVWMELRRINEFRHRCMVSLRCSARNSVNRSKPESVPRA